MILLHNQKLVIYFRLEKTILHILKIEFEAMAIVFVRGVNSMAKQQAAIDEEANSRGRYVVKAVQSWLIYKDDITIHHYKLEQI